ncbi:hypothetical protein E5288_WYG015330 [Bos mutus]|uniref:Uncharacterized protein n=1 Tax=Bos mutus TaxID=72004 RepID=A0A6B0RCY1_9CETA|nr:hypothetical protein [Bos mutus]
MKAHVDISARRRAAAYVLPQKGSLLLAEASWWRLTFCGLIFSQPVSAFPHTAWSLSVFGILIYFEKPYRPCLLCSGLPQWYVCTINEHDTLASANRSGAILQKEGKHRCDSGHRRTGALRLRQASCPRRDGCQP